MLYSSKPSLYSLKNVPERLAKLFKVEGGKGRCSLNSGYALEYESLRKELSKPKSNAVSLLSHLWLANTAAAPSYILNVFSMFPLDPAQIPVPVGAF